VQGVIALLALIAMIYGAGLVIKVQAEKDMAVILKSTESFFEPRTGSTVHFKLSEGMKVKILKSEGFWGKVERSDGKIGWVDLSVLEKI